MKDGQEYQLGVDLNQDVIIDAVSKEFDGREVSKSICTHERYFIPWYDLRKISVGNLKQYQTYQINNADYQRTRIERIVFLTSIVLNPNVFSLYVLEYYQHFTLCLFLKKQKVWKKHYLIYLP